MAQDHDILFPFWSAQGLYFAFVSVTHTVAALESHIQYWVHLIRPECGSNSAGSSKVMSVWCQWDGIFLIWSSKGHRPSCEHRSTPAERVGGCGGSVGGKWCSVAGMPMLWPFNSQSNEWKWFIFYSNFLFYAIKVVQLQILFGGCISKGILLNQTCGATHWGDLLWQGGAKCSLFIYFIIRVIINLICLAIVLHHVVCPHITDTRKTDMFWCARLYVHKFNLMSCLIFKLLLKKISNSHFCKATLNMDVASGLKKLSQCIRA